MTQKVQLKSIILIVVLFTIFLILYVVYENTTFFKKSLRDPFGTTWGGSSQFLTGFDGVYFINRSINLDWFVLFYTVEKVKSANKKAFSILGSNYAKDDKNVFFGANMINDVDHSSFEVFDPNLGPGYRGYAKDKKSIYYVGEKCNEIDSGSFNVFDGDDGFIFRDKNGVYLQCTGKECTKKCDIFKLDQVDHKTFEKIGILEYRDKNHNYKYDSKLGLYVVEDDARHIDNEGQKEELLEDIWETYSNSNIGYEILFPNNFIAEINDNNDLILENKNKDIQIVISRREYNNNIKNSADVMLELKNTGIYSNVKLGKFIELEYFDNLDVKDISYFAFNNDFGNYYVLKVSDENFFLNQDVIKKVLETFIIL